MRHKKSLLFLFAAQCLFGCGQLNQKQQDQSKTDQSLQPTVSSKKEEQRFALPANSGPFAESSVALDTTTGQLCKTYPWQDNDHTPKGLPLCSGLNEMHEASLSGATKAYKGFMYRFDGTKWVKGGSAKKYNEKTQGMDTWSDDQYDPIGLFTKEEKAKTVLKREQILNVAKTFGVTYEEASEEAKQQGYQVPPPYSKDNPFVPH